MKIRYAELAPHEQLQPDELLDLAVLAEQYGFDAIHTTDHFHPWAHTDARCGFAWVWMAVAAERTKTISLATGVTAPIFRYNPAIIAQAFATLDWMFPGRIQLGLGTGEAMNEVPVGYRWSSFKERAERLVEAVRMIRSLWEKSFVDFDGRYFRLRRANLYTKPKTKIPLLIAASGPKSARIAGMYGDGIITIPIESDLPPLEFYKRVILPAFDEGAKASGRDPDTLLKVTSESILYKDDPKNALKDLRFWSATRIPRILGSPVYDPRELEDMGRRIDDEQLLSELYIAEEPEECIEKIGQLIELGFNMIRLRSPTRDQRHFITSFGKEVLPILKKRFSD